MTTVLETRSLVKRFGGLAATDDVSLAVERGATASPHQEKRWQF